MTDEVAVAVLTDNHAQNATLAVEVTSARSLLDAHERFLRALERSGRLVRSVEALPDDRQLAERRRDGQRADQPRAVGAARLRQARGRRRRAAVRRCPTTRRSSGLLVDYFPRRAARALPARRSPATRCAGRSSPPR